MNTLIEPQILLPTEEQIEETIQKINDILELPEIDLPKNAAVKEGYDLAVDILVEDLREVKDVDFTRCRTIQGRAIAMLTQDYLKGEISQEILVGVGLKK